MTHYLIHFPSGSITMSVSSDTIIQSPSPFESLLGTPWHGFLHLAQELQLQIVPLVNTGKSDFITLDDIEYEIRWSDDHTHIKRISKTIGNRVYDIRFESLPLLLKMTL